MLLTELYNDEYNHVLKTPVEAVLGSVLKRDTESIEDFNMLGFYTKEYKTYDIKKFFGLSLAEYIDSTSFFKRTIIKEAVTAMEELQSELDRVQGANKAAIDDIEELTNG